MVPMKSLLHQLFTSNLLLWLLTALVSCKVNHLADVQISAYRVAEVENINEDPEILAMISPYKTQVEEEMNVVIGRAVEKMEKSEGTLGNWMADVVLRQGQIYDGGHIDCALLNTGGIRIPALQKGPITKGLVFELMPFDNQLVVVEMNASVFQQLADKMAERGGWPLSEGLRYTIQDGKAVGVLIRGAAPDPAKTYRILLPDYIANGGDDCFFLVDQPQKELGVLVRDAIIECVSRDSQEGREQYPGKLGRISKP